MRCTIADIFKFNHPGYGYGRKAASRCGQDNLQLGERRAAFDEARDV